MKAFSFFLFSFFFLHKFIFAQKSPLEYEIKLMYYIKNNPVFPSTSQVPFAFSLGKIINTKNSKAPLKWNLHFISHGNPSQMGYALASGVSYPFTLKKNLVLEPQIGLAYHTKKYDEFNNPIQVTIGSRITNMSKIQLHYYKNRWAFSIGAIHFSNGNVRFPNIGLNGVVVGAKYALQPLQKLAIKFEKEPFKKHFRFETSYSLGWKGGSVHTGPLYPVQALQISANYHTSKYHAWKLFSLIFKDNFIKDKDNLDERYKVETWKNHTTWSVGLAHEFIYHRTFLQVQSGIIIHQKSIPRSWISSGLNVGYSFLKNDKIPFEIAGFAGVKAYFGLADFTELGIRVQWK